MGRRHREQCMSRRLDTHKNRRAQPEALFLRAQKPWGLTMLPVLLDESNAWRALLPLTFGRHTAEIRHGIFTNRERWEILAGRPVELWHASPFGGEQIPDPAHVDHVVVDAAVPADREWVDRVLNLDRGEALFADGRVWALRSDRPVSLAEATDGFRRIEATPTAPPLTHPIDVFLHNGPCLAHDRALVSFREITSELPSDVGVRGPHGVWAEGDYTIGAGVLFNTDEGPVLLGDSAHIMEGAMLRGPVYVGPHSTVKMGAKIYGPTTIGPWCKVGGEVSRSVFQGYANKAHDGFLGDSVIGEWCNLGADTNNSNLSNNYAPVKVWSYVKEGFIRTPHQFVGLVLGDHSKSAINTMFNTGTVVGFSSNVFGAGFPRKFIPSFSWGGAQGYKEYRLDKAMETAERVMARRNRTFTEADRARFVRVFEYTARFRNYS